MPRYYESLHSHSMFLKPHIYKLIVNQKDKYIYMYIYIYIWLLTPPLSTPLAPDNYGQIHMWRVRGFPLGSPPEGR